MQNRNNDPKQKQFEEQVIEVKSVVKVNKGGRQRRFSACVVDGRTIQHEVTGVNGAAKIFLRPAAAGTGVIAGGAVRAVLELAGVKDILSKSLGSRTKLNMATATINALKSVKSAEEVAKLRGKTVEEILG